MITEHTDRFFTLYFKVAFFNITVIIENESHSLHYQSLSITEGGNTVLIHLISYSRNLQHLL